MIVRFVGPIASKIGKEVEIRIEKEISVEEAIEKIRELYPQVKNDLLDLSFYNISLNGELLKKDELETRKVADTDILILIPAIAGGRKEKKIKLIIGRNFDISTPVYDSFERKYGFFARLAWEIKKKIGYAELVLDVGCGTGVLGEVFSDSKVVGLDISPGMVGIARNRLYDALIGDGSRLPFRDSSFDAAAFNAVIFLIPDGEKALRDAVRVVRENGTVCGTYIVGLFEGDEEVLEKIGLNHSLPFPWKSVEKAIGRLNGITDEISFRVKREFVVDFYSIPAMSNALFPKMELEKRLELVKQKLSNLPDEMDFVWRVFRISV